MTPNPYKRSRKRTDPSGRARRMDEHRWLMEAHLGRRLDRHELVHHINGDKRDNRLENLEVVTAAEHAMAHGMWKHPVVKTCEHCGVQFTPAPTKRARAKACSMTCGQALTAIKLAKPAAKYSKYSAAASPSRKAAQLPQVAAAFLRALD